MTIARTARALRTAALAAVCCLALPAGAWACSTDASAYFETFLDTTCLQTPLVNTELGALGGLRLTTNGTPVSTVWDTDTQLDGGVSHESVTFPPVGASTLARSGTGPTASLGLPTTLLPLTRDNANPVLLPSSPVALDNDSVDDPSVIKAGSTYTMFYSATAEDGSGPAIFRVTSTDGKVWTRPVPNDPVLEGTPGAFDEHGVYGPDVLYQPEDSAAPYKMYYSGRGEVFGAIGYATSTDGVSWTKRMDGGTPDAVLDHGQAGSADAFSAADPSVMKDGATWKMWYTGDDSNKRRVAYATSPDGISWSKGGGVIAPEDPGVSANLEFGAFAPTVWKDGATYRMLLAGRKIVSGTTFQTKILGSTSSDGISWSGPSPELNPSGTSTNFDFSNLNAPDVLEDPGSADPFKAYYSGNTLDANGNFHTRIGLARSASGASFSKFNGAQAGNSVLDIGTLGTDFDSREASGLSVTAPSGATPKLAGFYWGTRGSDFKPRLGHATSADGTAWTKVAGLDSGGALLPLGSGAAFDNGGQRDPSVLNESGAYHLYFTGLDSGSTRSIGYSTTTEDAVTKQPDASGWTNPPNTALLAGDGSGFDASAVAHPSLVKDGSTYVMYYTGTAGGVSSIGRATASSPAGPFTRDASATLGPGAAGSFDATSVKDPVVIKDGSTYRMLYTGVETLEGEPIERVGYATSADGVSWTKQGVVLNPSQEPYADDEAGVEATGMLVDGSTLHVWSNGLNRTSRVGGDHATAAYPLPGSPTSGIPNGWATYQLGDPSTSPRDFRSITRTSSGSTVELWMSFLQPYSQAGKEFWSDFFPVTVPNNPETLNFLLTVRGVRWQARLSSPATTPALDKVEISHAPVAFSAGGSATTNPIAPPAGSPPTSWMSLTVSADLFSPGGSGTGSANVKVLDATTNEQLAAAALNLNGDTTVNLGGISPQAHTALRLAFDLTSDGQATPVLTSFKLLYNSGSPPPPPPPPPAPVLTLTASTPAVVFGRPVTLTGTLTQGGAPMGGQAVSLLAQEIGASAFSPLASATTDAAGAYTSVVRPSKGTTYKASYAGVAGEPTVSVAVKHLVTLRVRRRGTRGTFTGAVGPRHPRRGVVIEKRSAGRWVKFTTLKTNSKSRYSTVKRLKRRAKYQFRARTAADADHLAGVSKVALVDAQKVSLSATVKGRTVTLTGRVTPSHPGQAVVIKVQKGGSFVRFAKLKLSRRSTFALKRKLARGTYSFRADRPGDRDHFPGKSPVRTVTVR
jgi:predicted GH43/DUF377 family glycosyl hydrolase